jgi:hypothetical protein
MLSGYCDVVGVRFAERIGRPIPPVLLAVAVELKLTNVAAVIRQARYNLHFAHESYCAMPNTRCAKMLPATLERFRAARVGLLSVSVDQVEVLIKSGEGKWQDRYRRKLWRRVSRMPLSQPAGGQ